MIAFKHVSKRFGDNVVLDDLSLDFPRNEIVFLIGRSGMGKSVLLKHIVGLLRPDSGEIWIDDVEVTRLPEAQYHDIRKKCGMVFQNPALLDSLTVYENVAFGVRAHRLLDDEKAIRRRVVEKLKSVNLGESVLSRYPTELSFGQQKRVSLARTLAVEPRYLLFDEPTTGLDPVSTASINKLILDLTRQLEATAIVVSHDMHCALAIADRIYLLNKGKIVEAGKPTDFLKSDSLLAKEFLLEARARRADAD